MGTRAHEGSGTKRKGKRKALRLERVPCGGGVWAAVCVDTRMKHSKTASATNYPTAAEIGMRHYACCKLIGHNTHTGEKEEEVQEEGEQEEEEDSYLGFCLFAQRAGSCNNNSGRRTPRTAKGFAFSLSSIALLVCSAPAAVPVAVNSVASLLCNVSANGVCTVFGNTLN